MQFQTGMDVLWKVIKDHPTVTSDLLVHHAQGLKYQTFRKLYDINYSDIGSNRRLMEEDTIYSWECFVKDSAGTVIFGLDSCYIRGCP